MDKAALENKAKVFISGGFGKITVGDVSAGDNMASGIADVGYDGVGVDNVAEGLKGKSSRDLLYEFSAGGVSFAVSTDTAGDGAAMGVKYSLDPISVGIGYASESPEGGSKATVISAGVGASLAGVSTNLMYSRKSTSGGGSENSVGMDASFAASDNLTVTIAGASSEDMDMVKSSAFGVGLTFDLGGGATLGTGIGSIKEGDDSKTKADLGLNLEF